VEMMKEKFAKLLLGEDMSGGAKGVCTAMAISNAITNLSGTHSLLFQKHVLSHLCTRVSPHLSSPVCTENIISLFTC
jgi:hypothetical protein